MKPTLDPSRRKSRFWLIPVATLGLLVILGVVLFGVEIRRSIQGAVPIYAVSDIHGLAIDPSNPSILWMPTHQGLARFRPGVGWEVVGAVGRDTMGLNIDRRNPLIMYSGAHPNVSELAAGKPRHSGLLVSRDQGKSWQPVALEGQVDFHALAMSQADPAIFYMSGIYVDGEERPGLLYVSPDSGGTWEAVDTGLQRIQALAAHPQDPDVVLAGTPEGLFASTDRGRHWQPRSSTLQRVSVTAFAFSPRDSLVAWAYAQRPDLGLLTTGDGGGTWEPMGLYLESDDWINYIAVHPEDPDKLYLATQSLDVYAATNGGRSLTVMMRNGIVR